MKSLVHYIEENGQWKWEPRSISTGTIGKYRHELESWIREKYGELNSDTFIQAFKDTYKGYLEADRDSKMTSDKIEKEYNDECKRCKRLVKELGYVQFETHCMGQGYYDYMHWYINNEKNENA